MKLIILDTHHWGIKFLWLKSVSPTENENKTTNYSNCIIMYCLKKKQCNTVSAKIAAKIPNHQESDGNFYHHLYNNNITFQMSN